MNNLLPFDPKLLAKNWGKFLTLGILLVILGIIAVSAAAFTTLASIIFLGALIGASGVLIIFDTFASWWGKWNGFFVHLILGVLYLAVGIVLIRYPIPTSISITLFLGIFYIFIGIFRTFYSFSLKTPWWKWSLINGIVSLLLGILIMLSWPASGLYIIGLFIGIDLLFCGWSYIMAALAAHGMIK